jgi:sigma-E factor negative regulatory protein RseA
MKEYSQKLSSLIDNELDDDLVMNEIFDDVELQQKFSRYQLIGDTIRDDYSNLTLQVDVVDGVMAAIKNDVLEKQAEVIFLSEKQPKTNVVSFMKRFGQYAVAASVAGVVIVSSLMVNQNSATDPSVAPVLNTVPFTGSAAPVSLQVTTPATKDAVKEHNDHLEALLKDHQLQLQIQP